jgi:hypothetical protein
MQSPKGWQKQERVGESMRGSRDDSRSLGERDEGDIDQHSDARKTIKARTSTETVSKREQGIRNLQKLGFCRDSCVKGLDVGKGDLGITLRHMLQERIQETVPKVTRGSGHRVIPAADTRRGRHRGNMDKDSRTKSDDPRHAVTKRLGQRGLDLVPIVQDGNSQFRAVAQQIFEDQSVHKMLRALACESIRTHSVCFEAHIQELHPRLSLSQYLATMQEDAAGDVMTLQALAGLLRVEFQVVVENDKHDMMWTTESVWPEGHSRQNEYTLASHNGPGGLECYSASAAKKVGKPLTPLQVALEGIDYDALGKVCRALRPSDTIPSTSSFDISRRTLESLRDTRWLRSDILNWFMEWWGERSGGSVDRKAYVRKQGFLKCHFLNSYFYAKLMEKGRFSYARVKRWTNQVDVFDTDKIIIPVNLDNTHWVVAVVNNATKRIEIFIETRYICPSWVGHSHYCP